MKRLTTAVLLCWLTSTHTPCGFRVKVEMLVNSVYAKTVYAKQKYTCEVLFLFYRQLNKNSKAPDFQKTELKCLTLIWHDSPYQDLCLSESFDNPCSDFEALNASNCCRLPSFNQNNRGGCCSCKNILFRNVRSVAATISSLSWVFAFYFQIFLVYVGLSTERNLNLFSVVLATERVSERAALHCGTPRKSNMTLTK